MNEVEIFGLDIKPYILSTLNAKHSNSGYTLEPQNSKASFDFSSFEGKIKIDIVSKRVSGNGRCTINGQEITILSKISHKTEIELEENKTLEIIRDSSGSGKIIISGFTITTIGHDGQAIVTVDKMPENWKKTLSRCGNIKGIRLVNNQLLAAEGAYIQRADIIESIITNPPGCCAINDNIKFIYPCEITDITLKQNIHTAAPMKPIYKHMLAPIKISEQNSENIKADKYNHQVVFPKGIQTVTGSKNNSIIYDSYDVGLNPNTLHNTANISLNNKGLLLNKDAKFSIPISNLKPYTQYVIVATLRKMTGNGKFSICFSSSDGNQRASTAIVCPDKLVELYIKLHSEYEPHVGSSYFLTLTRPEGGNIGEIYIERLMIVQGISTPSYNSIKQHNTAPINENNGYVLFSSEIEHPIISSIKKYAIHTPQLKSDLTLNNAGNIVINTTSSMKWFLKIKNICPNINLQNETNNSLLMSSLGNLRQCNNVWIDVFNNEISEQDDKILKNCNNIYSPSLDNINLLKTKYKNVIYLEKPWPYIKPKEMPLPIKNYMFFIHRKNSITKRLFESWTSDMPPILIVGYRGEVPDYVYAMNEYINYDNMLYAMLNAKLIIDLPEHNNYLSGFLSLANSSGIPTITSNWQGLFNNSKFLISKDEVGNIKIPTIKMLTNSILEMLTCNIFNNTLDKHNDKLIKFLSTVF